MRVLYHNKSYYMYNLLGNSPQDETHNWVGLGALADPAKYNKRPFCFQPSFDKLSTIQFISQLSIDNNRPVQANYPVSVAVTDYKTKKTYFLMAIENDFQTDTGSYFYTATYTPNKEDATYFFIHQGDDYGPLVEGVPMYFTTYYSGPVRDAALGMNSLGSNVMCALRSQHHSNVYWMCVSTPLPPPSTGAYGMVYGSHKHSSSSKTNKEWLIVLGVLGVVILAAYLLYRNRKSY